MNEEMWAELTAQVEEHGHDKIELHWELGDIDNHLDVIDIKFEDGAIRVELG